MPTQRKLRIIRRAARSAGIRPRILYGVWGAESDFGRNRNTSSAGARGPFQIMPFHEGVDPYNFRQAANWAARYLGAYKGRGVAGMLAAYNAGPAGNPNNPETQRYIPRVRQLAQQWPGVRGGGGRDRGGQDGGGRNGGDGGGGAQELLRALSGPSPAADLGGGSEGTLALLQALQGSQRAPQASSSGLPVPAHLAGPVMPQGVQAPVSGGGPAPRVDTSALLQAIRTIGEGTPGTGGGMEFPTFGGGQQQGGGRQQGGGGGQPSGENFHGRGRAILAPGADRAGVSTNGPVLTFVRHLSGRLGRPLTIGTGTSHSQYTQSGNVSDHWEGNAADVPLAGRALTRAGRQALIQAGMSPAQARKAKGGIYNLNHNGYRVQVIFNTTEGGNHWNHLHVGLRRL